MPARKPGRAAPPAPAGGDPPPAPASSFHLLFVCTGNTCRSPLAEGIARAEAARRGWDGLSVRSAGLSAGRDEPAAAHAVSVAARAGIDLGGHRAQGLTPQLADWADLILAMSPAHVAALARLGAAEKTATLGDFAAGPQGEGATVADPWGGEEADYAETFRQLRELITAAFDRLAPLLAP